MASKKSAAKVKVAPRKQPQNLPPIEDVFNEAKDMFALTVDTQIKTAARVDNLLNIRDMAKRFWDIPSVKMDDCKRYQQVSIDAYKSIREKVDEFSFEEFEKDTVKDYFEGIIPKVEDIKDDKQLLEAAIIFMSVQPYGQKLIQLHQLIQDEIAKRRED